MKIAATHRSILKQLFQIPTMGQFTGRKSQETWVLMQGLFTPDGPIFSQASVSLLET